jgi:branched-chain amino acid transport system permease protein
MPLFYIILATEAAIFGLFAVSLDLIMGYAGLVSLGHAAFFGLGAYVSSLLTLHSKMPFPLILACAVLLNAVIGSVVGFLSIRAKGIYFAMLTLAFGEMIYRIVYEWKGLTGGSDGINGIVPPPVLGLPLSDAKIYYFFVLLLVVVLFWVCRRLVESPFGSVLQAIRENEERVDFLGYSVRKYKLISFIFSSSLAGLAGALYSPLAGFANPSLLEFSLSGKVVVMSLLGGIGTLTGPLIGGIFLTVFELFIGSYVKNYLIVIGFTFVIIVLFLPGGIYGFFRYNVMAILRPRVNTSAQR